MKTSIALGFRFRCRFLGCAFRDHSETFRERICLLCSLITAALGIIYRVYKLDDMIKLTNPSNLESIRDRPYGRTNQQQRRSWPSEFVGIIGLLLRKDRAYILEWSIWKRQGHCFITDFPLNEIIYDFFDALKITFRGYASLVAK